MTKKIHILGNGDMSQMMPEKMRYDYLDCERIMREKKSSAYVSPQSASYL